MEQNNQPKTREDWFNLVKAHTDSPLSQAEFCKERNLKPHQFCYYRRQYFLKFETPIKKEFTPMVVNPTKNNHVSDIKIELPNGFSCYVATHISSEILKKLISTLLSC